MASTFADVEKSSATNYLFLFAQRTLALQNEAPTPPPLNVVGVPCEAMRLLWDMLWDWLHLLLRVHGLITPPSSSSGTALELEEVAMKKEALDKERSAFNSKKAAKKIAPLAKKIREYILDHQDKSAQEDRWRTTMQRDMDKRFGEQREEAQKVKEEVQKVREEVKETLQLVKNIADLMKYSPSSSALPRPSTSTLQALEA